MDLQITLHLLFKFDNAVPRVLQCTKIDERDSMKDTVYHTKTDLNKCTKELSSFLIVLSMSHFKIRKNTLNHQYSYNTRITSNTLVNFNNLT